MSRDTFVHTNSIIQAAKQHSQRTRGKAVLPDEQADLAFGLLANGTVYRWRRIHLPRVCPASHFERWKESRDFLLVKKKMDVVVFVIRRDSPAHHGALGALGVQSVTAHPLID